MGCTPVQTGKKSEEIPQMPARPSLEGPQDRSAGKERMLDAKALTQKKRASDPFYALHNADQVT